MQISSWNTSPSSWRVKLAGPTVCSAADTGSFVAGEDCPWAALHNWSPSGDQPAALSDARAILKRGGNAGCCKFRGMNKIRFLISLALEKLWEEGGGDEVSFLQKLGWQRNVKLHSFLPYCSWKLTQEIGVGDSFLTGIPDSSSPEAEMVTRSWVLSRELPANFVDWVKSSSKQVSGKCFDSLRYIFAYLKISGTYDSFLFAQILKRANRQGP